MEGSDLTVRDDRVFLKTLEGLRPVDVILRKIDDALCDPLELQGDSFLAAWSDWCQPHTLGTWRLPTRWGAAWSKRPLF